MNTLTISLLVASCVFAGGLAGMYIDRVLPQRHLTKETQDVIRLGIGMLSVLASLVLGLLIATAKTSYDTTDHAFRTYAAELALLNEVLRDYGGKASVPRDLLRQYTERLLLDGWPNEAPSPTGANMKEPGRDGRTAPAGALTSAPEGQRPAALDNQKTEQLLEHVREAIRALKPTDEGQKSLQQSAVDININLLRQRWLLIEQQGPAVQRTVLVVLVSWVTVIFASFGINAPRNSTIMLAFLICSLAIGGSIFLILELDRPLDGVMRISSLPLRNVLANMGWE